MLTRKGKDGLKAMILLAREQGTERRRPAGFEQCSDEQNDE